MNKKILLLALLCINQPAFSDGSEFNASSGALFIPTVIIGNQLIYDAKLQLNSEGLFSVSSYNATKEKSSESTEPLLISGSGVVEKNLPDDIDGSRHQKFILKLASGQTVLISHNIDLAPRINSLAVGNTVEFYGEYVWNSKGGLVHWTHHDPSGIHESGWLKHAGIVYR
ncbi:MAG: DUF3465 domain-containing protein [Methylococcaceae bacterium]|nr:DUF3465 domain-containing protein [Methylococcaceae bacterium]